MEQTSSITKKLFKEPRYAWFIVSFLWLFGFLGSLGRVIVQYFQGPITDDLGITRGFIGYSWSISIFVGSICAPLGGWLTDKLGYKFTMIVGSILGVLSGVIILSFASPLGYMIGFGVLGGLAGIGASTSYVIVNEWFQHHKAKALMIIGSAGSIGLALLTPFIVANDSWLTWTVSYKISIVVGIAFIVLTFLFIRETKKSKKAALDAEQTGRFNNKKAQIASAIKALFVYLRNPVIATVIFALFTCGFSMGTVEMHLMAIQLTAHVSHSMFIASLSILGVLELVGGFVFAVLLDRLPRAIALSCLYLIRVIAFIILLGQF